MLPVSSLTPGDEYDHVGHSSGAFLKCSSVLSLSQRILEASAATASDALEWVDEDEHRSCGEGAAAAGGVVAAGSTTDAVAGLANSTWAVENSMRV